MLTTAFLRSLRRPAVASIVFLALGVSGACRNKETEEEKTTSETITVDVPPAQKDSPERHAYTTALQQAPEAYAMTTAEGGKHAFSNVGYGLAGEIADGKLTIRPSGGRSRWTLGFKALRFGYGGIARAMPPAAETTAAANRLDIKHGAMTESVVNSLLGIQYGVTFGTDPKGKGADDRLLLVVSAQGDVKPALAADGRTIEFRDSHGEVVLRARDLLAMSGAKAQPVGVTLAQQNEVFIALSTKEATFPLSVSLLFTPPTALTPADSAGDDGYGDSVACGGSTAVVGAPGKSLVYVSSRTPSGWKQQVRLSSKDAGQGTDFGAAVGVDGSTLVVGAPRATSDKGGTRGAAFVFSASGENWSQTAKLQSTEATDMLGASVAVSEEVVALGAPGAVASAVPGGVHLFAKDAKGAWSEVAKLKSADGAHRFGRSIALSPGTVYVGAENAVYVFTKRGNVWSQKAKIASPDGDVDFGASLSAMQDTLLVGAPGKGVVYPFVGANGVWTQRGVLSPQAPMKGFGTSVASNGTTVLVGAPAFAVGAAGAVGGVSAFTRKGQAWAETARLLPIDPVGAEAFGTSVAMSGESALVGTHLVAKCPPDCNPAVGRAYSFVRLPAKTDGTKCNEDSECTSGVCADGVCCNERCDGPCDACSAAAKHGGADGECGKAAAGTDPRNRCTAENDHARSCKADGMCDGEGKCRTVAGAGTLCAGPSCGGGVLRRGACDGTTTGCKVTVVSCAPYGCANGGECRGSCSQDSDCAAGYACAAGACRKK